MSEIRLILLILLNLFMAASFMETNRLRQKTEALMQETIRLRHSCDTLLQGSVATK